MLETELFIENKEFILNPGNQEPGTGKSWILLRAPSYA